MSLGIMICLGFVGQGTEEKREERNMQRVPGSLHAGYL